MAKISEKNKKNYREVEVKLDKNQNINGIEVQMINQRVVTQLFSMAVSTKSKEAVITYNTTGTVSLKERFTEIFNKCDFSSLVLSLLNLTHDMEKNNMYNKNLLLLPEYMYFFPAQKNVVFCLYVPSPEFYNNVNFKDFLLSLANILHFDNSEDLEYISRYIKYLNKNQAFSFDEFKDFMYQIYYESIGKVPVMQETQQQPEQTPVEQTPVEQQPVVQPVVQQPAQPASVEQRVLMQTANKSQTVNVLEQAMQEQANLSMGANSNEIIQQPVAEKPSMDTSELSPEEYLKRTKQHEEVRFEEPVVLAKTEEPVGELKTEEVEEIPRFCGECGRERKPGAKFCIFCGNRFTLETDTVAEPEPEVAAAVAEPEYGETTVLAEDNDEEYGATTLLSEEVVYPIIIRKKTGEKAVIDKDNYIIGKERSKVDFAVSENSTVSRVHVYITNNNGQYYVTDNKSLNKTYIDGVMLIPEKPTPINEGQTLKLSNEEFEFTFKQN